MGTFPEEEIAIYGLASLRPPPGQLLHPRLKFHSGDKAMRGNSPWRTYAFLAFVTGVVFYFCLLPVLAQRPWQQGGFMREPLFWGLEVMAVCLIVTGYILISWTVFHMKERRNEEIRRQYYKRVLKGIDRKEDQH